MARGNQRDKAREKNQKESAAQVSVLRLDIQGKLMILHRRRKTTYALLYLVPVYAR